ncbi:LysE family translocator [Streptomyces venezuelae]|uniref:LysE family translocator n=1 Tax=Streptomyces venezuelae TaxID=54571 RepID=A0A5P2DC59_STRVZ|nr:LysE family translocator [Streptomyces venezuelae]
MAGFLAAVFPLIATPGTSLALLVQRVGEGGRRQAWPVVLGTVAGLYVHAAMAVAGLSALVVHSARAFTAVRIAGACWLIGLGLWTWYAARRAGTAPGTSPGASGRGGSGFLQALLANVLNPKAASVYLTLVPQFIEPGRPLPAQVLVPATAHALLLALWLLGWTVLVRRASGVLRRPGFRAALGRVTAVVLIGLGIRTAVAA